MAGRTSSWLPESPSLTPYLTGVHKFVEDHISIDSDRIESYKPKSIVDPILGYIHLKPWEVAFLDTRLFQRLRKIRQLGLAHLVFPTLGYSRFEHTVGVLGRTAIVLNKLVENQQRTSPDDTAALQAIIRQFEIPIRLAALFHDVGHCLFSHVSERVIIGLSGHGSYPSAIEIQKSFTEHFQKEDPISFAEVFSVTILGAPIVAEMLDELPIPEKTREHVQRWTEQAARFILGLPIPDRPDTLFLAQLLSSGLDVDKLDYMAREAHFSGIRLELDMERILDKLRVFEIDSPNLPRKLCDHKHLFGAGGKYRVLGLARGGQFSFEEFCVSRVALYEKIYLHQKIRAAEAQLSVYLRKILAKHIQFTEAHRWLYLHDSHVAHRTDEVPGLEKYGGLFQDSESKRDLQDFGLEKIDDRALVVRAFAFGPANSLSDPLRDTAQRADLNETPSYVLLGTIAASPDVFRTQVLEIATILSQTLNTEPIADDHDEIIIDLPRYATIQQSHDSVYFERPVRLPLRWTMPIDQIVEYYTTNRALAYVFAPKHHAPLITLAAEKALWDLAQATFVQETFVSGEIIREVESMRQDLTKLGFYNDALPLKPIPTYLRSAEAQEMIQNISTMLNEFSPPDRQKVTPSHTTTYVAQFPSELQAPALRFLQHMQYIADEVLISAIKSVVKQLELANRIALVPLGSMTDSAGHLLYYLRDVRSAQVMGEYQLTDSLVSHAAHIVFFDDNINSGHQTLNIFADWFGVKLPPELDLKEDHVQSLSEDAKERLRGIPITLVYAVGTEGAGEKVRELLAKHCNMNPSLISVHLERVLYTADRIFSSTESRFQDPKRNELRNFLKKVGAELLQSEGKNAEKAAGRALGYGGAEAMVVFRHNVPTMTITPLWLRGRLQKGDEWVPLVERNRRHSIDGELVGEDR
jgi:HD superfamily phosphohydrolase